MSITAPEGENIPADAITAATLSVYGVVPGDPWARRIRAVADVLAPAIARETLQRAADEYRRTHTCRAGENDADGCDAPDLVADWLRSLEVRA